MTPTQIHAIHPGRMALLSMGIALGCALGASATPEPRIACDEPVYHFTEKEAAAGEIKHTFLLKNTGDVSLELGQIETHCGCTDLKISHRFIPPGAQAELSVTLSLRGREGAIEKFLLVHSSDPKTPVLKLGFGGRVPFEAEVFPLAAMFGVIPEQGSITQSVEVVFAPGHENRMTGAECDRPEWFGATVTELEPNRRYRLDVVNAPAAGKSTGYLRAVIRPKVEKTMRHALEIPVTALVLDELIAGPDEIVIFSGETGPLTRFAAVRPGRVRQCRILSVETPDPSIRSTVSAQDQGWRIRLDGVRAGRGLNGQEIIIRTDVPTRPEIRIRFHEIKEEIPRSQSR